MFTFTITDPWFFFWLCAVFGFVLLAVASIGWSFYSPTEIGVYFLAGFVFLMGLEVLWKNELLHGNWFWVAILVTFIGMYWAAEELFSLVESLLENRAKKKLKKKEGDK